MAVKNNIPSPTLRRLPVYHRIFGKLLDSKKSKVSSGKLSSLTGFTASQIRQDLGYVGSFGLQGYGYNVEELYNALSEKLKICTPLKAIIVGAGNLGRAVSRNLSKKDTGINIVGIFDKNEAISGKIINGIPIRNLSVLEEFCLENKPSIAIFCIPEEEAYRITQQLHSFGIKGILNFSEAKLGAEFPDIMVEDVSFSDSLLTLRYYLDL